MFLFTTRLELYAKSKGALLQGGEKFVWRQLQ